MTLGVTAAVLAAALLHATWNALIKASRDVVFDTALVVAAAALVAALVIPWLPAPAAPSWPYLAASAVVHQGYFTLLAAAYRRGDLSFAYPLMRGLPPLLVALGGLALLPDPRSAWLWSGIAAISLGVLWIGGLHPRLLVTRARSAAVSCDRSRRRRKAFDSVAAIRSAAESRKCTARSMLSVPAMSIR
jgi:drug/metabolite transporter (DMT)-like permease